MHSSFSDIFSNSFLTKKTPLLLILLGHSICIWNMCIMYGYRDKAYKVKYFSCLSSLVYLQAFALTWSCPPIFWEITSSCFVSKVSYELFIVGNKIIWFNSSNVCEEIFLLLQSIKYYYCKHILPLIKSIINSFCDSRLISFIHLSCFTLRLLIVKSLRKIILDRIDRMF